MTYRASNIQENQYIESILDAINKEIAAVGTSPQNIDSSKEMDLLVADLLGYLNIDSIEDEF